MDTRLLSELAAAALYEQAYGRTWEEASPWARRASRDQAEAVIFALTRAGALSEDDAPLTAPQGFRRPTRPCAVPEALPGARR